jgi:hypothetical protein
LSLIVKTSRTKQGAMASLVRVHFQISWLVGSKTRSFGLAEVVAVELVHFLLEGESSTVVIGVALLWTVLVKLIKEPNEHMSHGFGSTLQSTNTAAVTLLAPNHLPDLRLNDGLLRPHVNGGP